MSARVFKPILLSEMPKMRSSPSLDVKLASRGITKVRRALFNPDPDPEENRRFLDEELAKIAVSQGERWGFDFLTGRPSFDTNTTQFSWIPVLANRPSVLLAPQRPVKHVISQSPDISDLYPPILLTPPAGHRDEEKMCVDESSPCKETPRKQLQSKITDYLAVRKRTEASLSATKKLAGCTPRPRKIPRLTTTS